MWVELGFVELGVVVALLLGVLVFAIGCFVEIIPAGRAVVLRNPITQQRRVLAAGLHLSMPWEQRARVLLPDGSGVVLTSEFITNTIMRYDPPPYPALTLDQIPVQIDLWIEYRLHDMLVLTERPNGNWQPALDDLVRARLQERVSVIPRAQLNTIKLQEALRSVTWPEWPSFRVTHVGIQDILFDAQTQALSRALSLGLTHQEALEHTERMSLNESVRSNRNAQVIVGGDTVGRVRPRHNVNE